MSRSINNKYIDCNWFVSTRNRTNVTAENMCTLSLRVMRKNENQQTSFSVLTKNNNNKDIKGTKQIKIA